MDMAWESLWSVPPKRTVEQHGGPENIIVVEGKILHPHCIPNALGGEHILRRNHSRTIKVREKISTTDLMVAPIIVNLTHELILCLDHAFVREISTAYPDRWATEPIWDPRKTAPPD